MKLEVTTTLVLRILIIVSAIVLLVNSSSINSSIIFSPSATHGQQCETNTRKLSNDVSGNSILKEEGEQEANDKYFHSLFNIYEQTSNNNKDPYAAFNSKYFLPANEQVKNAQLAFHGKREPLIVIYTDLQAYFFNSALDFERYGFDPAKIYNRTYTVDSYDILKSFAHSSLYIYYKFSIEVFKQADKVGETSSNLESISKLTVQVNNELANDLNMFLADLEEMNLHFQQERLIHNPLCLPERFEYVYDIQQKIVQMNRQFVDHILQQKQFSYQQVSQFAHTMLPYLMNSTEVVVRYTLANLNHIINEWRVNQHISDVEFKKTRVLIIAGSSPRANCMQSQFFLKVLNETRMGERVIYAENMYEVKEALDRLKTVYNDLSVGEAFFNDKFRMQQDLLSSITREYLAHNYMNMERDFLHMIEKCPHLQNRRFLKRKDAV